MNLDWIAVMEEKPQDFNHILLYDEREGEVVGYYEQIANKFISLVDGLTLRAVTHWMELPDKPTT